MSTRLPELLLSSSQAADALHFAAVHISDILFKVGASANIVSAAPDWLTFHLDGNCTEPKKDYLPDSFPTADGGEFGVMYTFREDMKKLWAMSDNDQTIFDVSPTPQKITQTAQFLGGLASVKMAKVSVTDCGMAIVEGDMTNWFNEQAVDEINRTLNAHPLVCARNDGTGGYQIETIEGLQVQLHPFAHAPGPLTR